MNIGPQVEIFAKNIGFKDPKKGRAIIIGGIALIIVGGIAIAYFSWRKRVNDKKFTVGEADKELADVKITNKNLTLSNGDAIIISQNLLNAMDQIGTDEKAIIDNLNRCKSADDLKLVIQKFGTKIYSGGNLATSWLQRQYGTMKNLNGWIRAELSGSSLAKVKKIYDDLGVAF